MLIIPVAALPAQTLTTVLGSQPCQIDVYQKFYGLFVDLSVNNVLIIGGVIAQNLNRIVRYKYLGFSGDLCFIDTQGDTDPYYLGLGDRYQFAYLQEGETVPL